MDSFIVNGREFRDIGAGDYEYESVFRDFTIRVFRIQTGQPGQVTAAWCAQQNVGLKTYDLTGRWASPEQAARQALSVWTADIEESDRADAVDADRERREYVRDNQLKKSDVI